MQPCAASLVTSCRDCAGGDLRRACPETCLTCPLPTCPAGVRCARAWAGWGRKCQCRS